MRRRGTIAALVLLSAGPLAAAARAQDPGGGAQVGGTVPSFFSLGLEQTASKVVATITSTDAPVALGVAGAGAGSFSASTGTAASGFRPLDPAFGLVLQRWDDVLAGRQATFRLRARSAKPSVVLVTLTAQTP